MLTFSCLLELQVDESVLSSENGEDQPLPPPPPSSSTETSKGQTFPWLQMALPGGGIVSVPLDRASSSSSKKGDPAADDLNSPTRQLVKPSSPPLPTTVPTSSATGSVGSVTQADLLTVAAGEPVTHFNLDQLLEIVQSFQLDTTMASHDETLRTARDLVLCTDLVSFVQQL